MAGTELCYNLAIPALGIVNLWFPKGLRFDVGDYLVGGAATANTETITIMGEIGIA